MDKLDYFENVDYDKQFYVHCYLRAKALGLFLGHSIHWCSDDILGEEQESFVDISKQANSYRLDFHINNNGICFKNGVGDYEPFNLLFRDLFVKLENCDKQFQQVAAQEHFYKNQK